MKRLLLLKSLFLLCALVVGTSAWADSQNFPYSDFSGQGTSGSGSSMTGATHGDITVSGVGYGASGHVKIYANQTLTITPKNGATVTQIVLTAVSGYIKTWDASDDSDVKITGTTTATWTGSSTSAIKLTNTQSAQARITNIAVTYTVPAAAVATPTFSVAGGTYTSTQSVELACATGGATIYYTLDGSTPTDGSTEYTGTAISVSETKTINAIAKKGSDYSNVASATYTIYPVLHAGTAGDPYTVADARNAIDANTGLTDVYVSGIVCEGGSELTSGAMNYWISDDGTETNKFEIYQGKGISGADFSAISDVKEGDAVVVTGTIKKFGTVYEFQTGSQLVSLVPSANPLISVTPTSLTGFTYGAGFGPSDAQTFSVEGSNLTENISLSLGESNYEMSLSEGSGYTNSLTLTQTAGSVAATTIYVRLKAGLAVNASYEETVTLTSTGATGKAVSLAGSVTQPNFTWDLSTTSYDASPTENQVIWTSSYATMTNDKGSSSTAANNYLGGDANKRTSSRFYKDQILTITPTSGYAISSIVFTATSDGYATALKNSTWTNATAAVNEKLVTVTPTNGALPISATIGANCGFTAVKVYYGVATSVTLTPAKEYTTLTSSHNLNFTDVTGLKAFIATEISEGKVQMTQVKKVPAGTGLVLKATTPGSAVNVPVFDGTSPDDVSGNKMVGSATETTAVTENGGYILKDGVFQPATAGTLAAGKAYLKIAVSAGARALEMNFDDNETTAVNEITNTNLTNNTNEFFDLQGRKVAQPTKGLYIVNGKKVVVK